MIFPEVSLKRINDDIKQNTFARVYLLYGPESYLRLFYTDKLCSAVLPESDTMNRALFEGDKTKESDIIDFAETIPFFAEHRLIRVKDSGFFKGSCELLPDYMKNIPEHAVIVFSEGEVDKRNRLFKPVRAAGYVSEFTAQKEDKLLQWGANLLKKGGLSISRNDMNYLLSRTGTDMSHIMLEIDKLINYCSGQKAVTRQDIDAITGTQLENRIFEMIDAITDGNQAKALSLYADLLSLKEPPMRILYLIARQYNQLLTVRELMDEGNSAGAIVQKTGMRDFVVRRNMNRAKSFSVQRLRDNVAKCIEMEESVKTGRIGDRLSVELLLVQFSEQRKS